MGEKKSDFIQQTTTLDADTFDFVSQGQNIKITKADLVALFGTTGGLEQAGAVLSTPILNKSGTINQIRSLEDGQGVKASVSPENGATLEHNFVPGSSGQAVLVDNPDLSTLIRNLVGGTGINVSVVGDSLKLVATGLVVASNIVIVGEMSDFPDAIGGVRTLAADTGYLIVANLTTSDRFVMGSKTVVFGEDRFISSITYTGIGAMFTGVDVSSHIKDVTLTAETGKIFDITSSIPGDLFLFDNNTIDSCDILGTMSGMTGTRLSNLTVRDVKTNGINFTGANGVLLINGLLSTVNGGKLFDLGTATFDSFSAISCFTTLVGGTFFLSGVTASANITSGNLGSIDNSRFFGAGTPLETISVNDARWQFTSNDAIQDTRPDGMLSLQGNVTETVITVAGTYELVAGTWVVEATSQGSGTAAGRITYEGQKDARLPITTSISVEPVSGVSISISARISVNGTTVPGSQRTGTASSGSPTSITLPWQETFSTNDFVEVFVTNEDNTTNLLVSSGVHRVN